MKPDIVPFAQYEMMYDKSRNELGEWHMIKANIPRDWASYRSNNGEGIWLIIDDEDKRKYDADASEGTFYGILCVPCTYHPQLITRIVDQQKREITPLEFEWRGAKRPVLAKKELEQLIGR
jgi:hypothetical protein